MTEKSSFHTLKGYQMSEDSDMTAAMEDYLEMIFRLCRQNSEVRVRLLAEKLNVRPPSASKMVDKLRSLGLVSSKKYGYIALTEKGGALGQYLLYRHEVVNRLLCLITGNSDELTGAEKIEHFIDPRTVCAIEAFLERMEK